MIFNKGNLLVYILSFTLLVLLFTGCGKTSNNEKKDVETKQETVNIKENIEQDRENISDNQTESEEGNKTTVEDSNGEPNKQEGSNDKETSVEKPINNSENSNQSHNKDNASRTTQKPQKNEKKPVERISEEVKSDVMPYKFGVTKQDITVNDYMLYNDNSKELLTSYNYTIYDSSGFSATDSELKLESELGVTRYNNYYQEVLRLVNKIRADAGVGPLTLDTTLCKAASMRALEMDYGNLMSHTRPNGSTCWTVLDFYNVSFGTCGENVAAGQTSPSAVVEGWKNSQGHYENMVNPSFTKLGVGYSSNGVGSMKHYWCQLFSD